jgi:predicted membrane-bound spermidine synthase
VASQVQLETATQGLRAEWHVYLGLFLISLATLMYELLLTRIFSVTLSYHFAFMAISIAVFGMTAGAVAVYLKPDIFPAAKTTDHLAISGLAFAVSIAATFWAQTQVMAVPSNIPILYILAAIPFFFGGISVCLALTRFPSQVSKLYCADLLGGAFGCLLLPAGLNELGGPSLVLAIAAVAGLASVLYGLSGDKRITAACGTGMVVLIAVCALNTQFSFVRIQNSKGLPEPPVMYEKWNTFSRIRILDIGQTPNGWGFSSAMPENIKIDQMRLDIDSAASTVLTRYDGDLSKVDYLKYDVSNIVHHVKHGADILVVGVGGGRDILSALLFGQKSVTGVELNPATVNLLTRVYSDFTGNLQTDPRVTIANDEARSYIARSRRKFDIIQLSLIDTWAATSAGAFSLSENALYTQEAWKILLDHLQPDGIISCSRWYTPSRPAELYRLVSLAVAALKTSGVENPRDRVAVVYSGLKPGGLGIATVLVKQSPFTAQELASLNKAARDMRFEIVVDPGTSRDANMDALLGPNYETFVKNYRFNAEPPTDDQPFFFQMARLHDWQHINLTEAPENGGSLLAVTTLLVLLVLVTGLTLLCIVLPLSLTAKNFRLREASPLLVYFCAIGFAYMFIEVSQIQRLSIFLGHPTYSLVVVLFTLLLSSGIGSFITNGMKDTRAFKAALAAIPALLIVIGTMTPFITQNFEGANTAERIAIVVIMVALMGLAMGAAFPIGMKLSAEKFSQLTPWFWGLNGATSVLASVLAMAIAITFSITAAFWTGVAFYVLALLMCILITNKKSNGYRSFQ